MVNPGKLELGNAVALISMAPANVKKFEGGRGEKEKEIFAAVNKNYDNLLEVKASYTGNYSAWPRGAYRYM